MSDLDSLVGAFTNIPKLENAACIGLWWLFDPPASDESADDAEARQAAALQKCHSCAALRECRRWVDSLKKSQRPAGVVAGYAPVKRDR